MSVSTEWCQYCPAFWTHLDALSPMLEELGAQIVFSEVESNTGGSIGTQRANDHMNPYTPNGSGIRFGDGDNIYEPDGLQRRRRGLLPVLARYPSQRHADHRARALR